MLVVFPKPKWSWSTDFCTRVRPSTMHWALRASAGWGLLCRGDAAALLFGWCCRCFSWRRSAFRKQGIGGPTAQDVDLPLPPCSACPPPSPIPALHCAWLLVSGMFWCSFPKERPLVSGRGLVGECIFWASRDGERTHGLIILSKSLPLHPWLTQHWVLNNLPVTPWVCQPPLHGYPLQRQ